MAQNDQNRGNPSYGSFQDRESKRDEFRQQNSFRDRENDYGFGNTSFGNESDQYGTGRNFGNTDEHYDTRSYGSRSNQAYRDNYNRVNYMPDNDDNRNFTQGNYGNVNYGSAGSFGSGDQMRQDYRSGGYDPVHQQKSFDNSKYGNQYSRDYQYDTYRNTGYENDFQGQDWRFRNVNQNDYSSGYQDWKNTGMSNWRDTDDFNRRVVRDRNRGDYNDWNNYQDTNRPQRGYRSSYDGGFGATGNTYAGKDYPGTNERRERYTPSTGYNRDRDWWERTRDEVSSWFGDDDAERRRRQDKIADHRGKGPKGYTRSADRIRDDVCDRLTDDDRLDATDINVQVQDHDVILTGTVHNREEKRRAEDLVDSISGVNNVENRLRIGRPDSGMREYTGTTDNLGGIGNESGTTNEIIRNTRNKTTNK